MAPVSRLIRVVIIVPAILLVMAIIIAVAPVPVAPMPMPPAVMIPVAMIPAMVPVTAVAIPVTPPAAIARLLNRCGLLRLQRRNVGHQYRGARLRNISPKCNGHRAAQRDERKQFSHMLLPLPNRQKIATRTFVPAPWTDHSRYCIWDVSVQPNPPKLIPVEAACQGGVACSRHHGSSGSAGRGSSAPLASSLPQLSEQLGNI